MADNYDDIISLPHHVSTKRAKMSLYDRAAQFSPFAALTGHEDAIEETARLTDNKAELDEKTKAILNKKLQIINENIKMKMAVTITYFLPDEFKDGGRYVMTKGFVKKIDYVTKVIIMDDRTVIPIYDVSQISCEIFKEYGIEE